MDAEEDRQAKALTETDWLLSQKVSPNREKGPPGWSWCPSHVLSGPCLSTLVTAAQKQTWRGQTGRLGPQHCSASGQGNIQTKTIRLFVVHVSRKNIRLQKIKKLNAVRILGRLVWLCVCVCCVRWCWGGLLKRLPVSRWSIYRGRGVCGWAWAQMCIGSVCDMGIYYYVNISFLPVLCTSWQRCVHFSIQVESGPDGVSPLWSPADLICINNVCIRWVRRPNLHTTSMFFLSLRMNLIKLHPLANSKYGFNMYFRVEKNHNPYNLTFCRSTSY